MTVMAIAAATKLTSLKVCIVTKLMVSVPVFDCYDKLLFNLAVKSET